MKNRIKKYSFWTGLSAAVIIFVNAIGKAFGFEIDNKIIEDIIMAICGILVVFGIVCLPTNEETVEDEPTQDNNEKTKDTEEISQDEKKDE